MYDYLFSFRYFASIFSVRYIQLSINYYVIISCPFRAHEITFCTKNNESYFTIYFFLILVQVTQTARSNSFYVSINTTLSSIKSCPPPLIRYFSNPRVLPARLLLVIVLQIVIIRCTQLKLPWLKPCKYSTFYLKVQI